MYRPVRVGDSPANLRITTHEFVKISELENCGGVMGGDELQQGARVPRRYRGMIAARRGQTAGLAPGPYRDGFREYLSRCGFQEALGTILLRREYVDERPSGPEEILQCGKSSIFDCVHDAALPRV